MCLIHHDLVQFMPLSQIMKQMAEAPQIGQLYERIPSFLHRSGLFGKHKADFVKNVWGSSKVYWLSAASWGWSHSPLLHHLDTFDPQILGVFLTGAVAVSVPHFGHVLSLMGSVTFSTIAFVVPPVLYLRARQGEHTAQVRQRTSHLGSIASL